MIKLCQRTIAIIGLAVILALSPTKGAQAIPNEKATNTTIYYTETSGTAAGYYGSYRQSMPMEQLWQHVSRNNSQVW